MTYGELTHSLGEVLFSVREVMSISTQIHTEGQSRNSIRLLSACNGTTYSTTIGLATSLLVPI